MAEAMVSIVIPIYNVEKYLDRCMGSIVNQTYRNLEIILVDDGSPDSCPKKCDEWAKKDHRIKVIHKENAGLGMARNTGIEQAKGEYICFVDSDDYVALDTIENAIGRAEQNRSDIVLFGMTEVGADGKTKAVYCPSTEKMHYEGAEILDFVLPNMIEGSSKKGKHFNLNMSAVSCMFSMELITQNNWRFVSEREYISEDFYSLLRLYQHVKRVSVLRQACYYYCYNNASLTHVFRPDRYERICHCYSAMTDVCDELHYAERIKQCLAAQFFGSVIGAMKTVVLSENHRFRDKMKQLKAITAHDALRSALRTISLETETSGRKILIYTIRANCVTLVYLQIKAKLLFASRR